MDKSISLGEKEEAAAVPAFHKSLQQIAHERQMDFRLYLTEIQPVSST